MCVYVCELASALALLLRPLRSDTFNFNPSKFHLILSAYLGLSDSDWDQEIEIDRTEALDCRNISVHGEVRRGLRTNKRVEREANRKQIVFASINHTVHFPSWSPLLKLSHTHTRIWIKLIAPMLKVSDNFPLLLLLPLKLYVWRAWLLFNRRRRR